MTELEALGNEYHAYRQSTDHQRLLWQGHLDSLDEWEDVAPEAIRRRQERLRAFADRSEALVDPETSPSDRTLAESIAFTARAFANCLTWRNELEFPNPAVGIHSVVQTFLPRYRLITADHGAAHHRKQRRLASVLDDIADALREAVDEGRAPLRRHLTATIANIDAQLSKAAADDPLAAQAPPVELSGHEAERWSAETHRIVADEIRPALARYRDTLADVADTGRPDDHPGLMHLDGGDDLYRDLIWSHTSLARSGEQIHQTGLEQVAKLEDEYRHLAGPLLGTDDIDEIYARLRDDESMRYRSGADIVADATAALRRAADAAPDWFATIPESPCVAAEIAQGALAFYSRPVPEAQKPGTFFFNTADPSAWSRFQLEAVTFHESIPGHHLQLALLTESDTIHPVNKDIPVTAHAEGWGLYSERLADEMGLYSGDTHRLGMLAMDSMRACRLVTDSGMHALGWSRDRAIRYFLGHSPLSRAIATGEIDRYIALPGQALAYMMGRLEIDAMREVAERHPDFTIEGFHDRVLGHGMVPLATLRRIVLEV